MANSNTEHSKKLRKAASEKAIQKVLQNGGIRFSVLLEQPYAKQFAEIAEMQGSKKKALIYLLKNHEKSTKNLDKITLTK